MAIDDSSHCNKTQWFDCQQQLWVMSQSLTLFMINVDGVCEHGLYGWESKPARCLYAGS